MTSHIGAQRLLHYDRRDLRGDLLAGVTVTAYLIPQVMAYSALAGLPPQTGLWVIVVTMSVYALIGSSRLLSVGPESTTALLTAAVLAPYALGDPLAVRRAGLPAGVPRRLLRAGLVVFCGSASSATCCPSPCSPGTWPAWRSS